MVPPDWNALGVFIIVSFAVAPVAVGLVALMFEYWDNH